MTRPAPIRSKRTPSPETGTRYTFLSEPGARERMNTAEKIQSESDLYPSRKGMRPAAGPRLDPVAYRPWSEGAPLDASSVEHFEKRGFLILRNVFSRTEIDAFAAEIDHLRNQPQSLRAETLVTEPLSGDVRSVFEVHRQNALFGSLAADRRLVDPISFLLDDRLYIHQSRINYKPGFTGKEFYWHSDFETWHVEDGMPRMRAVSASILLTENTVYNGPLMLIPGSHREFVSCVGETPENHYRQSLKKQEFGVPDHQTIKRMVAERGIEVATGQAGDVILFDCNIMHGSNGNITPLPRSNVFFVYNAVSNRLVEPFGSRPDFIAARRHSAPVPR